MHCGHVNNLNSTEIEAPVDRVSEMLKLTDLSHLQEDSKGSITKFIEENADVFWIEGEKLGQCNKNIDW